MTETGEKGPRYPEGHKFENREKAGQELANEIKRTFSPEDYEDAVIYALPKGGVVVAAEVARLLFVPLDLIVTKKIGSPEDPEIAIGVIDENDEELLSVKYDRDSVQEQIASAIERRNSQQKRLMKGRKPIKAEGKVAVIIDDGVASGWTMWGAVHGLRNTGVRKVIIATPVLGSSAESWLKRGAEKLGITIEFVGLVKRRADKWAVGDNYDSFEDVSEQEVLSILRQFT